MLLSCIAGGELTQCKHQACCKGCHCGESEGSLRSTRPRGRSWVVPRGPGVHRQGKAQLDNPGRILIIWPFSSLFSVFLIKLIWEALLGLNGSRGYKGRGLAQHQHTQKPWLILAENPEYNLGSYLVGQVQSYSKFSCSSTLYIVSPEPWRNGERHPSKLKQ